MAQSLWPFYKTVEVTTAQMLKKEKNLSCVADEVIKDDRNINVEFRICANCTRSLEPINVISSRNDGPYAMNTVLGWCTVRTISCKPNQKEFVNDIFVVQITNT